MSANTVNMQPTVPTDVLESKASAQRMKIHESITELRSQMHQALDVRARVRHHLLPVSAVVAGLGVILGFGVAGMLEPGPRRFF
jgi:hypothetical protein